MHLFVFLIIIASFLARVFLLETGFEVSSFLMGGARTREKGAKINR